MIVLSFESTAKTAAVAVLRDGAILSQMTAENTLTHSELLLPMANAVLSAASLSYSDIELYTCTVGPGSFTGVRIAVSLVKGLAFAHDIPCVGVSTLASLAENMAGMDGACLCPVMDARRGQVYQAYFCATQDGTVRLSDDRAVSIEDLLTELKESDDIPYLIGDGIDAVASACDAAGVAYRLPPQLLQKQSAVSTARVALAQANKGETVSADLLSPVYLRKPQAEREREERLAREAAEKSS